MTNRGVKVKSVEAATAPVDDLISPSMREFDLPIIVQSYDRIRMLQRVLDSQKLVRKRFSSSIDFRIEDAASVLEDLAYIQAMLEDR